METSIEPQIGDFPFAGESRAAFEALLRWKNRLQDIAVDNPLETLFVLVSGGAAVFYLAEKAVNERVNSYADALHYVATCLCVGYANLFPETQTGKLVAAIVMSLGPSLAAWVLEGRLTARERDIDPSFRSARRIAERGPGDSQVVERLEAILQELRRQREAAG
jgi:hypothetical protein